MSRFYLGATLSVLSVSIGCGLVRESPSEDSVDLRRDRMVTDLTSRPAADIEWASQFFVTQIYDAQWNPDGVENDAESNNCGPASFAMLMGARGGLAADLNAEAAIDHARAMMYPTFPEIDATAVNEDALIYGERALICIDDDYRTVYFDEVDDAASIPQGIAHGGGEPVYGYSWNAIDTLLNDEGAVIAHGHITQSWRDRFDGEYGTVGDGAIPHFIGLFRATTLGDVIVCDPMHKGGPVIMSRGELQAFFKSPVNEYDTAIRVVAWTDSSAESPVGSGDGLPGEWEQYGPVEVDEGSLVVTMTGTGDADLYVREGAEPTESHWDCRPNAGTSHEECRLEGPGRYYVGVRGYSAPSSDYTVSYRIEDSAPNTNQPLKHAEVVADEWRRLSPIEIDGSSTLVLTMINAGDADLYVREGAEPTESDWDCRPYSSSGEEQCRLAGAGTWYVGVRGFAAPSSTFTLSAAVEKRR